MAPFHTLQDDGSITITLNIHPTGSMLEQEEQIAKAVAEVGLLATQLSLKSFDTDGKPIVIDNLKHTSKGEEKKNFQTPWGEVSVNRHVYQSSFGGELVIPMERNARILGNTSTPKFAKMVSWKYAQLPASKVSDDLLINHARKTSRKLIQKLGATVGEIARENEFTWTYALPEFEEVVTHVSIGIDGTTTPIVKEGYRETMCGTLTFYNKVGDRIHTIYTACAPEYGKNTFYTVLDMEIGNIKKQFPEVTYIGLADGAKCNWTYLEGHTEVQILDFYHATEYLTKVSAVMHTNDTQRAVWIDAACSDLKHKSKGAPFILRELKLYRKKLNVKTSEVVDAAITYFTNNLERMEYAKYQKKGYSIGSGITEAACKVVAKQRLSSSGMRWKNPTVQHILLMRGLICTEGRWNQFWSKIDEDGI
jgi:hypothetical protein